MLVGRARLAPTYPAYGWSPKTRPARLAGRVKLSNYPPVVPCRWRKGSLASGHSGGMLEVMPYLPLLWRFVRDVEVPSVCCAEAFSLELGEVVCPCVVVTLEVVGCDDRFGEVASEVEFHHDV